MQGAPDIVENYFHCANNRLVSLKDCPKYIYTHFYCDNNDIESFDFLPDNVGGYIDLIGNIKLGNFQLTTDFERTKQLLEAKKINKLLPNEKKIRPPRS